MNMREAMKTSGLAYSTLVRYCAAGAFEASLPRGRRGGWDISERSFQVWLMRRRTKMGNAPAKAAARRALEMMGAGR